MASAKEKAAIGIGGSVGLSLIAWRTLFPWIGYDIPLLKHGIRMGKELQEDVKNNTLAIDIFEKTVKQIPKKPFIIFNGRIYTYEFVNQQACKVANVALSLGLKPKDAVALLMLNEPAFIWTFLGLQKIGVVVSCLNPNNRHKPLLHTITVSEARILIVGQGQELEQAVSDIQGDIKIPIYLSGITKESGTLKSWDKMMIVASPAEICQTVRASIHIESPACYIFTSGTTGLPKPAPGYQMKLLILTLFFSVVSLCPNDVVYIVLPLYHTVGIAGVMSTIKTGASLVLRDKFSSRQFFDDCRRYNVTVIQYIGELCRYLLALPESPRDKEHSIRAVIGNGLRMDIWEKFLKRFNINFIVEFYGATEGTGSLLSINGRPGAIGRMSPLMSKLSPTPMHLIKYDHKNDRPYRNKHGRCVPVSTGEPGLFISGIPPIYHDKFYKGSEEMSEKKMLRNVFVDGDKYFNSGDLMYMDNDYFVYFQDRLGDTFRWKGENVSTTEVANILSDIDFIQDSNVYGVTLPGHDGRAGMAAIQMRNNERLTADKLKRIYDHCVENLPSYAIPLFLRLEQATRVTATFKQNKVDLVREGCDPRNVSDPLYHLSNVAKTYLSLDIEAYNRFLQSRL